MKYNLKAFNDAVKYYENCLAQYKGKTFFAVLDVRDEKAFFALAPFSRAVHNLKGDLSVSIIQEKSEALDALMDVWNAYELLKKGVKNKVTISLNDFIDMVDKKAKGGFRKIFKKPDAFVSSDNKGFIISNGKGNTLKLRLRPEWFRKYRWDDLMVTNRIIWSQLYNIKKNEKVGIGFDLIAKADDIEYPLEDYLDSYALVRTAFLSCPARKKALKASSVRKTMLEEGERIGELSSTLLGCELDKNIDEPVFKRFKKLSSLLRLNRFKANDAAFFIKGEGYAGKHLFGEVIGYPTLNKKSRWDSPGGIIYQLPWSPQTKIDNRPPLCRLGFTDTLPIDIFIESCKIDWLKMKKDDDALIKKVSQSDKIVVDSGKTNFEVFLIGKNNKRREPLGSDVDVRHKLDPKCLKKGIKAGTYANVPGGEMFVTPEYMKGTLYGDVVISIDKSYVLSKKNPLVVKFDEKGYKIVGGPKSVIKKINEKKNEAMKVLLKQEKHKSLPQEIIDMKKKNFNKIGEFAINTNPKARLCNYLIVNEKIAGMIHVALGSGFEDDRPTVYHYDIVINAKEQKLDIYGVKKEKAKGGKPVKEKKLWMMKKGKLVV
ncbi:hypothetical protein JXB28_03765 [Candidatus Woesearchaeota archaeon]|nr:hypothetical protein [Candidatus Woesearchaeota archaeon]